MAATKDMGIVLRRLDYSETSQVLAVFTREFGQQRLIAKGIKRSTKTRVAVGVDLLELGDVVFTRRPNKEEVLGILTEWRQIDTFPHLRRELLRWHAAQYAAEITSQLTEPHDPHTGLFDALRRLLDAIQAAPALPALCEYIWTLLREIGLRPEMSVCVACGRPCDGVGINDSVLYFSVREGGIICRECEGAMIEKRRIAWETARDLRAGRFTEARDGGTGAFELLDYHVTETMGRPPRLAIPLKDLLKSQAKKRSGP